MPENKLDLLAHILETARNGTTKEQIILQTHVNPTLVDNSLSILQDLELLKERHNSPVSFFTTAKGDTFLRDYARLIRQFGADDLPK